MRRSLIVLACMALIATACGGSGGPDPADDPKAALRSALERLGEYEGIDLTITLSTDRDSLVALSEGELQGDQAETFLASSLNVKSRATEDPAEAQMEMVLDVNGDLVEMKGVGQTLYVRADVRELVETFGGNTSDVDAFVQEAPPQFDWVRTGAEGEWVALEGLDRLQEQLGGATPDAELQEQFAADLEQAIDEHSTVTSEGEEDAGHHLVAVIQVRPLFEVFRDTLAQFPGGDLPGSGLPDASQVPDEEVRLDAWVADDRLQGVELDILQFSDFGGGGDEIPEGVERFSVRFDIDEFTDEVQAPDAATSADLEQILQGFLGSIMPGGGFGGSEEVAPPPGDLEELCEQVKDLPPEVQEQFEQECPDL